MMILTLGLAMVVLALVFVGQRSVSAVQIERKQLLAMADCAALDAATRIDAPPPTTPRAAERWRSTAATVRAAVGRYVASHRSPSAWSGPGG